MCRPSARYRAIHGKRDARRVSGVVDESSSKGNAHNARQCARREGLAPNFARCMSERATGTGSNIGSDKTPIYGSVKWTSNYATRRTMLGIYRTISMVPRDTFDGRSACDLAATQRLQWWSCAPSSLWLDHSLRDGVRFAADFSKPLAVGVGPLPGHDSSIPSRTMGLRDAL